mgnify:CR=1 FL=1
MQARPPSRYSGFTMVELIVTNAEEPSEKMLFTMPMSEANLPNCHRVQNLGAVMFQVEA